MDGSKEHVDIHNKYLYMIVQGLAYANMDGTLTHSLMFVLIAAELY